MVSHKTGLEFQFDSELSMFITIPYSIFQGYHGEVNSFVLEQSRTTLLWKAAHLTWIDSVGLFEERKNAKQGNTFWILTMWQTGLQCYLTLSAHSCSLQRWGTGGSESRQCAQSLAAGMRQRTSRLRPVQHQSHLPTAPTKGHKKGTFTFEERQICCWEGVGCIWFACLLRRLLPQSDSLDYFEAAMSFLSPLGEPWRMCKGKKKPKKSIIGTRPRFAIMTSILQRSVYTLIRFRASI